MRLTAQQIQTLRAAVNDNPRCEEVSLRPLRTSSKAVSAMLLDSNGRTMLTMIVTADGEQS